MHGKPIISREIGAGISFINNDQRTGIVVPLSSPKDLWAAMSYLWDKPKVAVKMRHNAMARYEKLFTIEKCAIVTRLFINTYYMKSSNNQPIFFKLILI